MKKIFLILISLVLCFNLLAQRKKIQPKIPAFIICGAKGIYNTGILYNQNILEAHNQNYEWSFGHSYGFMLGYSFANSNAEIEAEYQFNTFTQKFSGEVGGKTYHSKIFLYSHDIPVLFKVTTAYEGYFEIGPQFSFVRSANYSSDLLQSLSVSVTKNFSQTNVSGVFGMGTNFNLATNLLFLQVGVRFQFGISDLEGVDALGQNLTSPVLYPKYRPTLLASVGFLVGLIYYIKMY